jgi:hypothetical protein
MKPFPLPARPLPARRLVDDKFGSAYLGVSRSQFRAWVARGLIPRVRAPGENGRPLRRLLCDINDLDRLIQRWKETT